MRDSERLRPRIGDVMGHAPFTPWRRWWSRLAARWRTSLAPRLISRDERFGLHQRMIYRRNGGLIWYNGEIEDVSLSGALLRGEKALAPGDLAQISFWLPEVDGARGPTQIFCWAKVVRIRLPQASEARHTLAVKIVRYRSEPKSPHDIREIVHEVRGPRPQQPLRKAA